MVSKWFKPALQCPFLGILCLRGCFDLMGRYEESVDQFASARMLFGRSIGADSPLYGSACASWLWRRDKGSDSFHFFFWGGFESCIRQLCHGQYLKYNAILEVINPISLGFTYLVRVDSLCF